MVQNSDRIEQDNHVSEARVEGDFEGDPISTGSASGASAREYSESSSEELQTEEEVEEENNAPTLIRSSRIRKLVEENNVPTLRRSSRVRKPVERLNLVHTCTPEINLTKLKGPGKLILFTQDRWNLYQNRKYSALYA